MINIKIQKKDLWLLSAIVVFLVGVAYVIAVSTWTDKPMFHSSDDIRVKIGSDYHSLQKAIDDGLLGGGSQALIVASGSSTGTPSTTLALPAGTWTVIGWMWNRGGAVPATALIIDGTTVASFQSMGDPTGTDTGTLMGVKTEVPGDRTIEISTTGITSGFVGVFSFAIRTGN